MKLTGNCKKAFRIWYEENMRHTPIMLPYESFMGCHDSIKYGVYVDFFESVGLELVLFKWRNKFNISIFEDDNTMNINEQIGKDKGYATRDLARENLLIKANDLFNEI